MTQKEQDFEWYKNICHSNFFKIVPTVGGNPNGALKKAQIKEMTEILKAEISYYKPTHILIIDGREKSPCWCFDAKEEIETHAKSQGVKLCFSDRPEIRKNSDLLKFVREDFGLTNK